MSSFYQLLSQAENDILENRLEEAQKKLDRAEVVKPGQITTQYLRAICFYKKGEQETAREILDAMDFENEYVKKFLKAIDKKNEKEKE